MQSVISITILAIAAYMDLRTRRIERRLLFLYFGAMVMGHTVLFFQKGVWTDFEEGKALILAKAAEVLIGMLPGMMCIVLSLVTRQALGYGDSLLILICGASLGLSKCIQVIMIAFAGAGAWAVLQILFRKADGGKEFPFAPFLLVGAVACVLQNL